jgi:hypothetical protein
MAGWLDGWMVEIHVCQISTPGHAVETGFTPHQKIPFSALWTKTPGSPNYTVHPSPHIHGRGLVAQIAGGAFALLIFRRNTYIQGYEYWMEF